MNRIIRYLVGISAIGCMALLAPAIDALAQADGAAIGPAATDVPQVETHTVFPTQDTYVDSTPVNADISFTDAEDLLLGRVNLGATSLRQRSYLRFDLSAIPQGATIQNAQLDLFQTVGSLNPILVYQAVNDWDAAETTWNNQPDFSVVDAWNAPATTDQYVTYAGDNLTVLVQTWVNAPVRNYGLMLDTSATSGDARQFHSVDRRSGQPPRLRFAVALPPIRVCDDPDCLKPSSGIEVVNRSTGKAYTTDTTGYVLDAGAIQLGDSLWGNAIMEQTAAAARYITTGDPQTVNAAAFVTYPGLNLPEMRLILQKPLLVRNLQVSAQWNLEGDPSYKTELAARIVDASDHFYRYTDGQFALGRVTVYQNYERWDDPVTDLWLHTNNAMRPLSYIKGDVLVQTADPMTPTVDFIYEPGHVYIGSDWNRYGVPSTQPTPPGTDTSHDWAAALGHELGHYLLGQFDSYIAVLPSGVVTQTYSCTGSAMGWVYEISNQAFVFDQTHWTSACGNTLGALNVKRTEWQTIQAWYPWAQTPEFVAPNSPSSPMPFTDVVFVPSSGPAPVANQVFDLGYQDGELASGEARAFLMRDTDGDGVPDRVLDQGRPPKGVSPPQVTLTGAQVQDRLCVIDINDRAQNPETPRHQFGCEHIEAGDNQLAMRRDIAWAPYIEINPIAPTQIGISVTQVVEGAVLRARLYPEHDATPTDTLNLAPGSDGWSGVFNVLGMTPSAFVQVWVDEPATEEIPRREAIIDYGVGGGAVPGPKQKIGFAPVTSSDGRAFFLLPANLELLVDQFVAIQSMAGTLQLPVGTEIIGQPYRLISLPPSLVAQGSINLYISSGVPGLVSAAAISQTEPRSIYFWDGSVWQKLPTTFSTDNEGEVLASAESMGVGVYAILVDLGERLYLPIVAS